VKEMSITTNYYETSDLGLAAALISSGVRLVKVDMANPKRAVFIFDKNQFKTSIIDEFWSGELKVSALRYFENTKVLKSRIYGGF
jgi:hypothetical protein